MKNSIKLILGVFLFIYSFSISNIVYITNINAHEVHPLSGVFIEPGKWKVIDGQTFIINDSKCRLYGIEAPGIEQLCFDQKSNAYPCGEIAKNTLEFFLSSADGRNIFVSTYGEDRDGTVIVELNLIGKLNIAGHESPKGSRAFVPVSLNTIFIRMGHALLGKTVAFMKEYREAQKKAMKSKGKFNICNGEFVQPSKYRKAIEDKKDPYENLTTCDILYEALIFTNKPNSQ